MLVLSSQKLYNCVISNVGIDVKVLTQRRINEEQKTVFFVVSLNKHNNVRL